MKYDVLEGFRTYVYENTKSLNTAKKYYGAVKKLFDDLQFNSLADIRKDEIEQRLCLVRGKNNFSATKCGLKLLKEYNSDLQLPDDTFFSNESNHKRNHRKKSSIINIGQIKRKINQISDMKLKLAYRLDLVSGLRVSELEALEPCDLSFVENKVIINVRHGKGNRQRFVESMPDKYLLEKLNEYVKGKDEHVKLFYTEEKMRKSANHLGMECHDLRRIYAHLHKKLLKKQGQTNYRANRIIQKNLGHARYKTTQKYLYGKKFIE